MEQVDPNGDGILDEDELEALDVDFKLGLGVLGESTPHSSHNKV